MNSFVLRVARLFLHFVCLMQFLFLLFSGFVSKIGGDQKDSSGEDEDKVKNGILEFG